MYVPPCYFVTFLARSTGLRIQLPGFWVQAQLGPREATILWPCLARCPAWGQQPPAGGSKEGPYRGEAALAGTLQCQGADGQQAAEPGKGQVWCSSTQSKGARSAKPALRSRPKIQQLSCYTGWKCPCPVEEETQFLKVAALRRLLNQKSFATGRKKPRGQRGNMPQGCEQSGRGSQGQHQL